MKKYICTHSTHPGEVLKDKVRYRGIVQSKLAIQIGISYKVLNDILNKRRPLTTHTAMLFEAALGISAKSLMRLQVNYSIQTALKDKTFSRRLAQIRKMCAAL